MYDFRFWHLLVTVGIQIIFGFGLEMGHGWTCAASIYIDGIIGGSLMVMVFTQQGLPYHSSAGVFALIAAHFGTLILVNPRKSI